MNVSCLATGVRRSTCRTLGRVRRLCLHFPKTKTRRGDFLLVDSENAGKCEPSALAEALHAPANMAAKKLLDRQPGTAPEIKRDGDSVTLVLEVAGAPEQVKLLLRCVGDDIFASLTNLPDRPRHETP